jgi:hypothetical protein
LLNNKHFAQQQTLCSTTNDLLNNKRFAQTRFGQTCFAQTCFAQTRIAQTRIAQTGIAQTRIAQTRIAQTHIGQTDLSQTPLIAIFGDEWLINALATVLAYWRPFWLAAVLVGIFLSPFTQGRKNRDRISVESKFSLLKPEKNDKMLFSVDKIQFPSNVLFL